MLTSFVTYCISCTFYEAFFADLCHSLLIHFRIQKISCLGNLFKLNILDLHDNQVLFLYHTPTRSVYVYIFLTLLYLFTVTSINDIQLQSELSLPPP